MSRKVQASPENNFIGGLVTDATALSFPENACTETFDCEFDLTGRVTRRLGIDYESGYAKYAPVKQATPKFSEHLWTAAGGTGSKSFVVQQYGHFVYFYDVSSNATPSAHRKSFAVDLDTYKPSGTTLVPRDYLCSFTQGNGTLIICNAATKPVYVTYDADLDTIAQAGYEISYRDFDGAVDEFTVDQRPTATYASLVSTYPNHFYNLWNQGWYDDPLDQWNVARPDMPSNSDRVSFYRQNETDALDPSRVGAYPQYKGTQAARGHFILQAANPNRPAAILAEYGGAVVVSGDVTTYYRPSCNTFFAGRAWYAGINAVGLASNIYFSQIIETTEQLSKCYQVNDPTSEFTADLLASDGGVIRIQEAGNVLKLFPLQSGVLVFADNGVWMITGSIGGFAANDYVVHKLSGVGTRSPQSVVDVKGTPVWWAEDGIYTVQAAQGSVETYDVISLTTRKLDTFYQSIPNANKTWVKGAYDPLEFVVTWVYNDTANLAQANYNVYNKILKLNVISKAFYPQTIDTTSTPSVRGVLWVNAADRSAHGIKFTTIEPINNIAEYVTYSEQWDDEYHDWDTAGTPVDYTSYLITGYKIHGEMQRFFQGNYIYTYMEMEDDASLYVNGIYEFGNSGDSGRWSTPQQAYKSRDNFDISVTRRKIRGKGHALQLKFVSDSNNPFTLIGWATWETANAGI